MDNIPAILSNMSSYGRIILQAILSIRRSYGWDNNKYNLYSYTFVKNIGTIVW